MMSGILGGKLASALRTLQFMIFRSDVGVVRLHDSKMPICPIRSVLLPSTEQFDLEITRAKMDGKAPISIPLIKPINLRPENH